SPSAPLGLSRSASECASAIDPTLPGRVRLTPATPIDPGRRDRPRTRPVGRGSVEGRDRDGGAGGVHQTGRAHVVGVAVHVLTPAALTVGDDHGSDPQAGATVDIEDALVSARPAAVIDPQEEPRRWAGVGRDVTDPLTVGRNERNRTQLGAGSRQEWSAGM